MRYSFKLAAIVLLGLTFQFVGCVKLSISERPEYWLDSLNISLCTINNIYRDVECIPQFDSNLFYYSISAIKVDSTITFQTYAKKEYDIHVNDYSNRSGYYSYPLALNPGFNVFKISISKTNTLTPRTQYVFEVFKDTI